MHTSFDTPTQKDTSGDIMATHMTLWLGVPVHTYVCTYNTDKLTVKSATKLCTYTYIHIYKRTEQNTLRYHTCTQVHYFELRTYILSGTHLYTYDYSGASLNISESRKSILRTLFHVPAAVKYFSACLH